MDEAHERERESYHECTQTQMDVIPDPSMLSPSHIEVKAEAPKPWARLVPSDPKSDVRTLEFHERKTCENGIFHKHILGRSRRSEHVIEDARVSSSHCMIFCQRIEAGGHCSFIPCIVDQSANGTYVNGSRLRKGARHVLKNGDEIALVNPISAGPKISFIAQIFLNQQRHDNSRYSTDSEVTDAGLRRRGETVRQMLHQGRNIMDYYDLVKVVGEGAYGQVYVALERTTGVQRAVKVVDTSKAALSSPTFLNTLLSEAEIMRTLQHPLIVQLEDVFASGPTFYFVMELLSGGDLFDRVVKKGFYLERDAVPLMRKLLTAIAFIHSRGVAHRDLKIENIMLESTHNDVDIKVTDFGLAKSGDAYQTFCGTPNYYAPEVLERKHNVRNDAKYSTIADMWSCGVIMYVILW
jgi:phosphorylase kinase gamma subunit/serine/threonine-protein kinase Chk2/calcium/calmodulin-dependent protein kinase I